MEVETVELGDPRFEETGRVNGIADDYRRLPFVRLHTDEEANRVPVAPHNCGGSVLHFADLHLGATVPNLTLMASVRGRHDGWHRDLVTTRAGADDGELLVPDGPGLGTTRRGGPRRRGITRRVTRPCPLSNRFGPRFGG
jgi:L-alanine-DL-glutamate epimerase-like enolase superfamily enzyme